MPSIVDPPTDGKTDPPPPQFEWQFSRGADETCRTCRRDLAEDCGHHSWAGLMALLDEHWPEDIFPTREDDIARDAGARIVSLIRWVDRLRGDV